MKREQAQERIELIRKMTSGLNAACPDLSLEDYKVVYDYINSFCVLTGDSKKKMKG